MNLLFIFELREGVFQIFSGRMQGIVIQDLSLTVHNRLLLQNFSLSIPQGEIHALMGKNGAGKSSLLKAIAGHPDYQITAGKIIFNTQDITDMSPDQRARLGLFLAFQHPVEIPGVSIANFLRAAMNAQGKKLETTAFYKKLYENMDLLKMDHSFSSRAINVDFSGGEKKRCEMLQMLMLQPSFVMLDEIDSGLDIDALKYVITAIQSLKNSTFSSIIVSHQKRLLQEIIPDRVHILDQGKIIFSGGPEIIDELENKGYSFFENQHI